MFYTFIDTRQWKPKISMYDIYNNNIDSNIIFSDKYFETTTIKTNDTTTSEAFQKHILSKVPKILALAEELKDKIPVYEVFNIPKKTGGFRTIASPNFETSDNLTKIKYMLEQDLKLIAHNAAYAYVKGRSTKDALIKHVKNNSNYYLKIDLKDFFTSCNKEFIIKQFNELQTINSLPQDAQDAMGIILNYCLLNDGLPQGSPVSPLITNLIMIPYDYYITRHCEELGFCYTRYADDILISHNETFKFNDMVKYLRGIFTDAPFTIKNEKTRYGSNKGRNWNLGLMVNKENKITIGYRKKERLRATIFNFFTDLTNGNTWDIVDVQAFQGTMAYYNKINPELVRNTIAKYETKFNTNLNLEIKKILNP